MSSSPEAQAALPDELLEDIFLWLDAAEDLARASAACTTFRRVVSARRFLRRFRSLHPPPLLGFHESDGHRAFHPADPPHRSAPAARALAQAADFSFSFLGNPIRWKVCDARDGRVLLYRRISDTDPSGDLVVCDPLHRRHIQLPPIPDDLATASGGWTIRESDPLLDPATEKEKGEQDLPFRVICTVQCQDKLVTFHFSSVTGKWRGMAFDRPLPLESCMVRYSELFKCQYAHSCFFWTYCGAESSFMLDTREMKVSIVDHPPSRYCNPLGRAFVEAGEGRLGLVNVGDTFLELYSKTLRNNGVGTEVWQYDKVIPLPEIDHCRNWIILGTAEGHILLQTTSWDPSHLPFGTPELHCFTLDLKTLLVERFCVLNKSIMGAHLYASFPPAWSLPSI